MQERMCTSFIVLMFLCLSFFDSCLKNSLVSAAAAPQTTQDNAQTLSFSETLAKAIKDLNELISYLTNALTKAVENEKIAASSTLPTTPPEISTIAKETTTSSRSPTTIRTSTTTTKSPTTRSSTTTKTTTSPTTTRQTTTTTTTSTPTTSQPTTVRSEVTDAPLTDLKYWTLYMHNYYRSMVARGLYPNKNGTMLPTASQMFALNWDDDLYQYAQNWANKCTFQHSNGPHGENLWMSSDNTIPDGPAIRGSIWAFMSEIKDYGLASTTFDSSIDWHNVGHAMQCIWAKYAMHTVACAVNRCSFGTIVVCEYGDGNVWTLPIYSRGPPCKTDSDCARRDIPNATCRADLGLCKVQEQSDLGLPNSTVRITGP